MRKYRTVCGDLKINKFDFNISCTWLLSIEATEERLSEAQRQVERAPEIFGVRSGIPSEGHLKKGTEKKIGILTRAEEGINHTNGF